MIPRTRGAGEPWFPGAVDYLFGIDAHAICLEASGVTANLLYLSGDGRFAVTRVIELADHLAVRGWQGVGVDPLRTDIDTACPAEKKSVKFKTFQVAPS